MSLPDRPVALAIADTRRWLDQHAHLLPIFTITDHPTDFPDYYVARLHFSLPQHHAHGLAIMDHDLTRLREIMAILGGHCLHRQSDDPPIVIESWIM